MTFRDLERRVVSLYSDQGPWTRFHVQGRLRSCPMESILEHVPEVGVLASLGCGHGSVELLAATRNPGCRVIGADLAKDKIAVARAAAARAGELDVRFYDEDLFVVLEREGIRPDAILICDVLCLIPKTEHEPIAQRAHDALAEGGRLLVKEMGSRPRWKRGWNAFQETLACRVLRFTYAPGPYLEFLTEEEWTRALSAMGFGSVSLHPMDRGYVHPHLLIRAEKAPAAANP